MELTEEEQKLIELMRQMVWGTIEEINIQNGQPKIIKRAWQSIRLESYEHGNQSTNPSNTRENGN